MTEVPSHDALAELIHTELSPLLTDTLGVEHGWDAADGLAEVIIKAGWGLAGDVLDAAASDGWGAVIEYSELTQKVPPVGYLHAWLRARATELRGQ